MPTTPQEYLFRVPGVAHDTPHGTRVAVAATRATTQQHLLRARDGEHVIVLTLANGPTLMLHPANAALLLQSQRPSSGRGAAAGSAAALPRGVVQVDAFLSFARGGTGEGDSRGLISRVVIEAVELIAGPLRKQAAWWTARAAAQALEARTVPGVHRMPPPSADPVFATAAALRAIPFGDRPVLVFVHGTFSSLRGSFGPLWQRHPALVQQLFDFYGDGIYGLEHHSITQTPLANARMLLEALPPNARVHLVTHSRGGLVGEALARAAREGGGAAFDRADFALLAGDGYATHRQELEALNALIAARKPRIERIVRVASPARGTLLASGRLDAYLGVLSWALEKAGLHVLPELADFAAEVARERADPAVFPGLEAMIPGRAVTQLLTRPDVRLASELRIVAGDIEGDSVLSWLKVLLTDAYYLTEHDLVVNTASMYGGTPRTTRPVFVFERGPQVGHFRYFVNASSARAIVEGLIAPAPASFRPVGPLSWDGRASDGLRALRPQIEDTGRRPAVFVLPGIMGSHLKVAGKRVWMSPTALAFGGLKKLRYPQFKASAEEPMDSYFGDLMEDLSDRFDVLAFAYDWRAPIEESARVLAESVTQALDARQGKGLPVRIVAHSMGGMVARAMEIVAPEVWRRFMAQEGARLVLAGTPNRGSFAPMLALSARHPLVNTVEAIDTCTSWKELKDLLGEFPGLMQLQCLCGADGADLTQRSTWQALAQTQALAPIHENTWQEAPPVLSRPHWGVPTQGALDATRQLRDALDARLESYQQHGSRIVLVAGCARQTIVDYREGEDGIEFIATAAGDGTVSWESLRLPGVACWRVAAEHGDLLKERSAFRAYRELLETGHTTLLPLLDEPGTRGRTAAMHAPLQPWISVRSPYSPTLGEIQAAALGSGLQPPAPAVAAANAGMPLEVQVLHADLKHVREPLLVGHYRSETLSGAERVLDTWIGGAMQHALNLGLYPAGHGEQQVFPNQQGGKNPFASVAPKPQAVIVAGLADEDQLTPQRLEEAAASAAMAWSQHVMHGGHDVPISLSLASLLVGTGGWRIDVGQSAVALVRGVMAANERLADEGLPVFARLTLVELYGDRASVAHSALAELQRQPEVPLRLAMHVESGEGARPRPVERGYRGASYDLVHVASEGPAQDELRFTLHTGRARSELRAQSTQRRLVDRLVASAESELQCDSQLSHALFNMLVPQEMRPVLAGASSLFMSLDAASARIPWELLQDRARSEAAPPFAVRVKMVRTLRLQEFRNNPADNRHLRDVLVIGAPRTDAGYALLPGAEEEARSVAELLAPQWKVEHLADEPDARRVLQTLAARDWRIVHVAGHGDFEPEPQTAAPDLMRYGGVVLDGGTFLGPKEIAALETVPELVFVNCCHLGKIEGGPAGARGPMSRPVFAATVAEQLMRIGVRCVVAAGWAVDDAAARAFAVSFYGALLERRPFTDAVLAARKAAWEADPQGNTWAAYQCYGDPAWTLRPGPGERRTRGAGGALAAPVQAPPTPTREDLLVALEDLRCDARSSALEEPARAALSARLAQFEERDGAQWGGQGGIAEAMGVAWGAVGDLPRAISWLARATAADDGGATVRSIEQLAVLRVRHAQGQEYAAGIEASLADLDRLIALQATPRRLALRGSAHKRLALLAARSGRPGAAALAQHLRHMVAAFADVVAAHAPTQGGGDLQPSMQAAAGQLLLRALAGQPTQTNPVGDALITAWSALLRAEREAPDFSSAVGRAEWELYRSLALQRLHAPCDDIAAILAAVHARAPDATQWISVRDDYELVCAVARLAPGWARQARAAELLLAQVQAYCNALR